MRVIVVGGGVIGLAAGYALATRGAEVVLVDAGDVGARPPASVGNAGGIAVTECMPASAPGLLRKVPGWLLDPLGPLHLRPAHLPRFLPWLRAFLAAGEIGRVRACAAALAALNARVYPTLEPMLREVGLADHLRRVGALVVYRDRGALAADALEWEIKAANGIAFEQVDRGAIAELEPAISPAMTCGVLQPAWSIVRDPASIVRGLRDYLRDRATFVDGEAAAIERGSGGASGIRLTDGRRLEGAAVVVAAGAWSAALARSVGDRVLLESERGYNKTLPNPGFELRRQLVFGAEKFVVTPLEPGLRIGGAAEFAGLEAPPNLARADRLVALARRGFRSLDETGATAWMGQRPATPDSLPVIGPSPRLPRLFYAFGHGHLGLTQSAPTGELVADLVLGRTPAFDPEPFRADRF